MPVDQDALTGKSRSDLLRALLFEVFLVEHRAFVTGARDERRVWITCRRPNLSVN
jgi:hypothetical protein